ncbi:MAG: hypothetical protein JXA73_10090 [Acidobacteria bacterium]|nr:hypothetical protein [Acidobacteriota bacterium]
MSAKKTISTILLVLGIVALILFALADRIGIGRNPGYGLQQIAGMIIGAVVAVVGLIMARRK